MKINILLLVITIAFAGLWTYFDQNKRTPNIQTPTYENFDFNNLDGKKHTLYDYKNKTTFVHFWATWCTPCLKELPELIALADNHPGTINILAFAVADQTEQINNFLSKIKTDIPANFIVALDDKKIISEQYFGTKKLPETYILAPNLNLYDKKIGAQADWADTKWYKVIEKF